MVDVRRCSGAARSILWATTRERRMTIVTKSVFTRSTRPPMHSFEAGVDGWKHIVQIDNARARVCVNIIYNNNNNNTLCIRIIINDIFTGSRARPLNRSSVSVSPIFTRCWYARSVPLPPWRHDYPRGGRVFSRVSTVFVRTPLASRWTLTAHCPAPQSTPDRHQQCTDNWTEWYDVRQYRVMIIYYYVLLW